jgi:RNA polymerase subunit RPABC4/transcription elongation factor Spt4
MISSVTPADLACVECGRRSDAEARGWHGYLVDTDDDGADEVVFFCPRCADREFGDLWRDALDPPST